MIVYFNRPYRDVACTKRVSRRRREAFGESRTKSALLYILVSCVRTLFHVDDDYLE